jgi:hypothetical protein
LHHQPLIDEVPLLPAASALSPAPEELQAFWKELPNAKLMHGDKVLQLAANTSFLGNEDFGQQMMVRECCAAVGNAGGGLQGGCQRQGHRRHAR